MEGGGWGDKRSHSRSTFHPPLSTALCSIKPTRVVVVVLPLDPVISIAGAELRSMVRMVSLLS